MFGGRKGRVTAIVLGLCFGGTAGVAIDFATCGRSSQSSRACQAGTAIPGEVVIPLDGTTETIRLAPGTHGKLILETSPSPTGVEVTR